MRISDWSSDVCASDLAVMRGDGEEAARRMRAHLMNATGALERHAASLKAEDRKSVVSGKSVSVSVDLGGRRIITKKNNNQQDQSTTDTTTTSIRITLSLTHQAHNPQYTKTKIY